MNSERQNHPSFAQLSFSRVHSNVKKPLYGSSLRHNETIVMTLSASVSDRALNETRYFPKETLFTVEMSPLQFAELFTTMNMGSGTPVTLRTKGIEMMPPCPFENERETFSKEFKKDLNSITESARKMTKRAQEILLTKNMKASERNELVNLLEGIKRELESNLPFVENMFEESMDKSVAAGKNEIDAFLKLVMTNAGIKALSEKDVFTYLPPKNDDEN